MRLRDNIYNVRILCDDIIHKAVEENFFYNIIHKPYFNKLNREIILNLNVYNSLRFNLYKIKK